MINMKELNTDFQQGQTERKSLLSFFHLA